ncbi:MAG TPA: hypothetical protein VNU46_04845 [Gemmatimonadaceae bacterium]|jgi:hypothetical protein|nr:hypothetical protein [Gemmatimonadaceae bacterium]
MRLLSCAGFLLLISSPLAAQTDMQLPANTSISILSAAAISSDTAKKGTHFTMTVNADIKVFGVSLIAKGAPVWATITAAQPAGSRGHPGSMTISVDSVQAVDGQHLPIANHIGQGATTVVWTAIGKDAGTFAILKKGNDVIYPAASHLSMVTLADAVIHVPDSMLKPASTDSTTPHADSTASHPAPPAAHKDSTSR